MSYLNNVTEGLRSLHMQTLTKHVTKITAEIRIGLDKRGKAEQRERGREKLEEKGKDKGVIKRKKLKVES